MDTEDLDGWAAGPLADAAWVHVAGLLRSHFPTATVSALRDGGRHLLLDAQGSLRRAAAGPLERDDDIDRELRAPHGPQGERGRGRILAGSLESEALRALGVPEVVLTLGSQGSRVIVGDTVADVAPAPSTAPSTRRAPGTRSPSSTSTGGREGSTPSPRRSGRPTPSPS